MKWCLRVIADREGRWGWAVAARARRRRWRTPLAVV